MSELWIPIVLFTAPAIVVSLWIYFRFRTRSALQQTVQAAIEKGQDLSPELLAQLGHPPSSPNADLRRGVISVALALAFAIFAFVLNEVDAIRPLLGLAAFPFMLGVSYLALWQFTGDKNS